MKTNLWLSLICLLAVLCSCGSNEIVNGPIKLTYDDQMRLKVCNSAEGADEYYQELIAPDLMITDKGLIEDWKLTGINKSVSEKGTTYILTGKGAISGNEITKVTTITALKDFPGMLEISTEFINDGSSSVTVKGLEVNRIRVAVNDGVWAFQPTSSERREDWVQPVVEKFHKENYTGMNDSDYGGGIPMVTLWRRDAGISIGLAEPQLKLVTMPTLRSEYGSYAQISLAKDYEMVLNPSEKVAFYNTFISVNKGDYFNPLRQFTEYMEKYHGFVAPQSPIESFDAVWCAWGYERSFTAEEVIGTLPKVKELGFKWVDVDDGYQLATGDWNANARVGGNAGMKRINDEIHKLGLKSKLWWAPMAATEDSQFFKEHPEAMLVKKDGSHEFISWWDAYYMSPVNQYSIDETLKIVDMFMNDWGFDGFKLDGQHLNLCEPDYNKASGLNYPEESVERFPEFFKAIYKRAKENNPNAVVQLCPCGCAINFFTIPYFDQAVSSDPESSWQIRSKGKTYKAIAPKLAYYGDHIELSDGGDDFGTQIGIGSVIGSKFTWPADNPNVQKKRSRRTPLLTPEKENMMKKWVSIYNDKMLSTGDYLNLYDIAFDKPEAHVIAKNGNMYYAFYADEWNGEPIELRGLDIKKQYTVCEYTDDAKTTYTISGANPIINPKFTRNYLIEVTEDK